MYSAEASKPDGTATTPRPISTMKMLSNLPPKLAGLVALGAGGQRQHRPVEAVEDADLQRVGLIVFEFVDAHRCFAKPLSAAGKSTMP